MKVILFGATGMIGQGVLRECLACHHAAQGLTSSTEASARLALR